jgi:type IV secretion system protein VirB9
MTRSFPAAIAAGLLAMSAPAAAEDPRLVERLYDPSEVVTIEGKVKVQTTIKFGEGETIENVAIGDSQAWQITPNKRANLLFVKPLAEQAATNMTVVTDKRTYYFDLVASPKARPFYALDFEYAAEAGKERQQETDASRLPTPVELAAANDPYAVVHPGSLNFDWRVKGDKKLLPDRVYDDGEATFLIWPVGQPLPAILVKDHEGTEGPVNFAVRGEVIVIAAVPREIVLRSGKNVAALFNEGPADRTGRAPPLALARANASEVK